MRIARSLGSALAVAALVPTLVAAQAAEKPPRSFDDSWFWGVKGGTAMFTTGGPSSEKISAPMVGLEWLITRTHGALNISVEQAFFDNSAGVFDPTSAGSVRSVSISDLRRYNASFLWFPVRFGSLRPYAGLGYAINVIQNATPLGTFTSDSSQTGVFERVNDQSSRAAISFTGGIQGQFQRVSLFAQVAAMPTRRNYLLSGSANTVLLEAGVRYNLLGAIDRNLP